MDFLGDNRTFRADQRIAHLVERNPSKVEVIGAIPISCVSAVLVFPVIPQEILNGGVCLICWLPFLVSAWTLVGI